MPLFRNRLHYGNIYTALKFCKQNTCADWGYVAPAFHCFLRSRSEQEVALSTAAISACMFFSLLATLTCFLFSLAPGCHANTTNRFHINFFPHYIPSRLVSSVVSSRSSLGCKAYWENAASCFVLHGTCIVFLSFLLLSYVFCCYTIPFPISLLSKERVCKDVLFIYIMAFAFFVFSSS